MIDPIHGYCTHQPWLVACLAHTSGPILELGPGWYSTPILWALNRATVSMENDREWFETLRGIYPDTPLHFLEYIEDWDDLINLGRLFWSVVLIDHEPHERRNTELQRLRNQAQLIVIHDQNQGICQLDGFKYRRVDQRLFPWTAVVSNFVPLDFLG